MIGHGVATALDGGALHVADQHDEPIRVRVRQSAQQHRIDEAEHRRVGADADREHQNRDDAEGRRLDQTADGISHVLGEMFERQKAPHFAGLLLQACDVAKLPRCRPPRFGRRCSGALVIGLAHGQMKLELVAEIPLAATFAEERAQAVPDADDDRGAASSRRLHDGRDRSRDAAPVRGFRVELAAAERAEAVELRAPVVVRRAPRRSKPAADLEAVQRRIERAFFDLEDVVDARWMKIAMP